MKKYAVLGLCLCLLAAAFLLFRGEKKEVPPAEVSQLYEAFLDVLAQGDEEAFFSYVYYDHLSYQLMSRGNVVPCFDIEVRRWEKLSDSLWSVVTYLRQQNWTEGKEYFHFIGMVDNQWRVIINKHNVPDDLAKGLDLSRFSYENELPLDDVQMYPIE